MELMEEAAVEDLGAGVEIHSIVQAERLYLRTTVGALATGLSGPLDCGDAHFEVSLLVLSGMAKAHLALEAIRAELHRCECGLPQQVTPLILVLVPDAESEGIARREAVDLSLIVPDRIQSVIYDACLELRTWLPHDLANAEGVRSALSRIVISVPETSCAQDGDLERLWGGTLFCTIHRGEFAQRKEEVVGVSHLRRAPLG
mmetsp:Transcript_54020/g.116015  ORF Transcript_54020/g.116015 Transcript_54020/m.116015 type:complete len:202 (+) Transcript_54020:1371-1976(+)